MERVPTFDGSRVEFAEFSKKLLTFVADEPGLWDTLKLIIIDASIKSKTIEKDFDELILLQNDAVQKLTDAEAISAELHAVLTMVTSGKPHSLVDSIDGNGFEAWRILDP